MTSVSVWLRNANPSASSSRAQRGVVLDHPVVDDRDRSPARPPTCGWAFRSLAGPCVAHRVWLIPHGPARGLAVERLLERPDPPRPLADDQPRPSSRVATPALSYPRYSSRRRPATRIGLASCAPGVADDPAHSHLQKQDDREQSDARS